VSLRVTVTGASGLIGGALLDRLAQRGDEITVLTRDPASFGEHGGITLHHWDPLAQPAPVDALAGRTAVIHLAGAPVAQRWSTKAKQAIRSSRVEGTGNLVKGIAACRLAERPAVLLSASAIGYYGPHAEEPIDEDAPPGTDFLAGVCAEWEAQALAAERLLRVVAIRTGVVLDSSGGALAKMLGPFRLGLGGPVAGGAQYVSWIHLADLVGLMLTAATDERFSGPVNATAPAPVTNREFSRLLGRALHRPALLGIPAFALRALYGEMSEIITTGARVMPAKALVLGYRFSYPELEGALRDVLS
jgi:hypothetical protein